MRRFSRRFAASARRPKHWHREWWQSALTSSTNNAVEVLSNSDYQGNTALSPSGVTLVRSILDFTIVPDEQATAQMDLWTWMLYVNDQDATALNPTTSQNLIDERILACGTVGSKLPTTALFGGQLMGYHVHVDTKQKVRLQDDRVLLIVRSEGDSSGQLIGTLSLLLVGDTT